jgi:putative acetyltransferase
MLEIFDAHTPAQVDAIRELFLEYAGSLEIDLCFQNFREELETLPGAYTPPDGGLLLARSDRAAAGCVAFRKIESATCEMKRLYVRPAFRGKGLGRALALAAIRHARKSGFGTMLLDTLRSMKSAIQLYESLGFARIEPYYHNPSGCALFMELDLVKFQSSAKTQVST